jgi:CRISPR system Cascade subunit CasB
MAEPRKTDADIAVAWWQGLQPDPDQKRPGDRAALARLRRCTRPEEAGIEPASIELARAMGIQRGHDPRLGDVLLTAIVLAHVRGDDPKQSLGRSLGAASSDQRARLTPLRLSRLLAAETWDERLVAFRRLVALLGGQLHLRDLARLLLNWGERNRIALVFDYHGVPPPGVETAETASPITPAGDAT